MNRTDTLQEKQDRLERTVLNPLVQTSTTYKLIMAGLAAVFVFGLYAFFTQARTGLIVTGMRDKVLWGLYISNFVFFIGISHAGTLISAILRVTKAGWRTPITRMAEFITVVALSMGAIMPAIDMGRPDRLYNLILHGRFQSPLVWDIVAISTYLTGSVVYLYLPMIEDMALCRDKLGAKASPIQRALYRVLAIGWIGSTLQKRHLATAMGIMAILIIPIAVSVHTVVSFIFAMTLRPGWNSTVYGAYFVAGAIYSGIATIIIVMAILRKAFKLYEYITDKHFIYLGYMLGAFVLIMAYFNVLEKVVPGYKMVEEERLLLTQILIGKFAPVYWGYVLFGLAIPGLIILLPWTRTMKGILLGAILINISMWFERFLVVVPTLHVPLMPGEPPSYWPTWVEVGITVGAISGFALVISIFAKIFPVISVWEVKEHQELEAGGGHAEPEVHVTSELSRVR